MSQFPLGPSLCQGSRLLHPGGPLPESPPLTCQSRFTSQLTLQNLKWQTQQLSCQSLVTPQRSTQCPFTSLLSHWPHMDLALHPLLRFHLRSTALLDYAFGGGGALSWIWLPLTTYLAPHYSCTSPMDCISHHSLHSHIPIHHYTNHTAVTNHSLALIVSPHLHLIHTHTFKQHSYMHSPRSLVLAPADISERYSSCYLLSLCLTPDCPTLELWTCDPDFCLVLFTSLPCLWYSCFCPLTFACLILPIKYLTALGSTRLWPVNTASVV